MAFLNKTYNDGSICVCCMKTEHLRELSSKSKSSDESYAEHIKTCFNIEVPHNDYYDRICENCISQLKDSVSFKQQILDTIAIYTSACSNDKKYAISKDKGLTKNILRSSDEKNVKEKEVSEHYDGTDDTSQDMEGNSQTKKESNSEYPYAANFDGTKCNMCGKQFYSNSLLKIHYGIHYQDHQCEECGKGFMTSIALENHKMSHKMEQHKCDYCNMAFKKLAALRNHIRLKHSSRSSTLYKCQYCDRKFKDLDRRNKHIQIHHEVVLYSCPLCDYKSKKQYLKFHMANKHLLGEKKHVCPHCNKKFTRGISLKEHVRIHLNDRKFKCRVCDKDFIHKCSLKSHIWTHVKHGEYSGDPQHLLDVAARSDDEYNDTEVLDEGVLQEETPDGAEVEQLDGMVEEFLLEDEELQEITNSLQKDGID